MNTCSSRICLSASLFSFSYCRVYDLEHLIRAAAEFVTSNITIRELATMDEFKACYELQRETWGASFSELVPVTVLRIAQRVGGIAAGAFDENDRLVGFVFGLTGIEPSGPAHWSDMLAVRSDLRNRGLGEALKRHQRELLLERGVQRAYWTFDPLESKNAYLNFVRLGTIAREYARDMYGSTASPLHQGIGTDRLVAIWEMGSDRVRRRLNGENTSVESGEIPAANELIEGDLPRSTEARLGLNAARVRITIPGDIQTLKSRQPDLAAHWRRSTRSAFEHYLQRGYVVVDFARESNRGSYTLEREALRS
jgi:predicted GNAT superfamily acetyltransferase